MGSFKNALLLLSVWFCVALCQDFVFTSNFSASEIQGNGWQYREIELVSFDALLWLGANFRSADVSGNIAGGSVDVVAGSVYVNVAQYPFSFLSYFESDYNLDIGAGQSFVGANVTASTGYVGTAYLRLEETAPNGTIVATRSLQWIVSLGVSDGLTYALSDELTGDENLQYVTFTGTSNAADNLVVNATFLVSSIAGIVNGTIPIVPKNLESVIIISGYPYQSAKNSLSLVLGVGTGGATVSGSGRTLFSQGRSVYFSLSDSAVVGGTVTPVSISAFLAGDLATDVGNANFAAQLQAKYNSAVSFNIVKVTFPPGADNIVYDPSSGTGVSPQDTASGAAPASVAPLVALLLAAVLLVVL